MKEIKRNLIADAFFECVSSFSEKTGASSFDSKASRSGADKKGELTRMTCVAGYERYDIEYNYLVRPYLPNGSASIFDVRVIFDRRRPHMKYSLYDIMYILDPGNFKCYHFAFIETPQRMTDIFRSIEGDLRKFLARMNVMAAQKSVTDDLEEKFKDGVNSFFGLDVFAGESEDHPENQTYREMLYRYYALSDTFYESNAYAQFLAGNYRAALKAMSKIRKKTYYQLRLASFIADLKEKYEAVAEGCDSTYEGVVAMKYRNVQLLIGTVLMFFPLAAAYIGLHYLIALTLFSGAVWNNALWFGNALQSVPFVLPLSAAFSFLLRRMPPVFLPKKQRIFFKNLDLINTRSGGGCIRIFSAAVLCFVIVLAFLDVNSYTAFYENGFRYKESITDLSGDFYRYEDVESIIHAEGRYDSMGNFLELPSYVISMKDGKKIDLIYEIPESAAEEKVIPLFEEKGIPVTEARDAGGIR